LRVDLHLHSRYSPDSRTSLAALIERCREVGLDRIALTDHNTAEGALELHSQEPELCIPGEEVKTSEGEVIGLFINASIPWGGRPETARFMTTSILARWTKASSSAGGLRQSSLTRH